MEKVEKMKKVMIKKSLVFFIILLFISLSFSCITGIKTSKKSNYNSEKLANLLEDDTLDSDIKLLMKLGDIPSCSACIIKNDSVVWSRGYGYYDRIYNPIRRKKASDDTIYKIGSISKSITASAVMQLYERGLFDLDDNVSEYLPFDLKNPKYPDVNITLRMLLAHQSSLLDHNEMNSTTYLFSNYPYSYIKEIILPDGEDYHPEFWADYPPGTKANYSNFGLILIGYLLEELTGQTLEEYCRENIFNPLKMRNTSFDVDKLDREYLSSHFLRFAGVYIQLPYMDFVFIDPCGGLQSTTEDLSHFLIAHMNGGVYKNNRILNDSTVELMHTVQYPNNKSNNLQFGLGWLIMKSSSITYEGHNGDLFFFHSIMRQISNDTGVIFCFNSDVTRPRMKQRILPFIRRLIAPGLIFDLLINKAEKI